MSLNEEVELLRRIPLFAKIEPSKLKLLAFTSQRLTYKPGDMLFRQGDPGDAAFVIIGGEANVIVDTPSGPLTVAHQIGGASCRERVWQAVLISVVCVTI